MGRVKISAQNVFELEELRQLLSNTEGHKEALNIVKISEVYQEKMVGGYCFWIGFKDDKPYRKRDERRAEHTLLS